MYRLLKDRQINRQINKQIKGYINKNKSINGYYIDINIDRYKYRQI